MTAKVVYAPARWREPRNQATIFLAGSIAMGKATDWQEEVAQELKDREVMFLNPRRPDWDASWEQRASNPEFNKQVRWELDGLMRADLVIMYFESSTQAPITLLELGLISQREAGSVIVACPDGYWRKGNVEIFCKLYGIKLVNSLDDLITATKKTLTSWNYK